MHTRKSIPHQGASTKRVMLVTLHSNGSFTEAQEEGEDADNWCFDVLWAAREAIAAANPWDHEAFLTVSLARHALDCAWRSIQPVGERCISR
jgi:hypothetical protein